MSAYRRQVVFEQIRPLVAAILIAAIVYPALTALWSARQDSLALPMWTARQDSLPLPMTAQPVAPTEFSSGPFPAELAVELAPVKAPGPLASGMAFSSTLGWAGLTNVAIAIDFIDGAVIQPGERFSFDDSARTWDFKEDPRYVPGPA
ncbi:MAG: VanW like protein, partial [Chloroflexi bacterium]|nr:VanW like protein [Chloroflexota bacterium]